VVWVRLDDEFSEHPKVAALGDLAPLAGWLHVCALCYCNRHLTDGFLPAGKLYTLASFRHLGVETGGPKDTAGHEHGIQIEELVAALLGVGMWDEASGGYQIHDYLDYQPSKAEYEELTEKRRQAGRAGGKASAQARAQAIAEPNAQARFKPGPVPVPDIYKKKGARRRPVENAAVENLRRRGSHKSEFQAIGDLLPDAIREELA
jgi:hypothetical protein